LKAFGASELLPKWQRGRAGGDHGQFQQSDVALLEPGVYISGVGGIRIEDDVLVTADGAEVPGSFPIDLCG
jgi:Xaa-Pro dipeptidase